MQAVVQTSLQTLLSSQQKGRGCCAGSANRPTAAFDGVMKNVLWMWAWFLGRLSQSQSSMDEPAQSPRLGSGGSSVKRFRDVSIVS